MYGLSGEGRRTGLGLVGLGWLRLFRRLFAGHEDVYSLCWENAKAGRLGDAPAAPMNGSSIIGGADGIRTRGLLTASQARSQLRHSPTSISV